ncbi:MAG: sigma-70 family RNA polymerase sigma factor [Fimbriiglobus sp.]
MSFIGVFRRWQRLSQEGDLDCLERYRANRDPEAFTHMMARYSSLVWAVCRRQLRSQADIEDAYQTTFLVLATKPEAVRDPAALGAWLHGTAWRVATRIRQRQRHEALPETAAPEDRLTEALQALDDELLELPAKYREPIVLCYLQELTQDQAAADLGLSRSTLRRRLEVGRERLRLRLERRGFELGGLLALTALGTSTAATTTTAATILTMTTALPAHLKPLLHGVIWTMFLEKIRLSIVVVAISGVTLTGLGLGLVTVTAQSPMPSAGTTPTPMGGIAPSPSKPPVTPTPATPAKPSEEIESLEHEIAIQELRIEAAREKIKMGEVIERMRATGTISQSDYSAARIEAIKAKEDLLVAERKKRLAQQDIAKLRGEKPAEPKAVTDAEIRKLLKQRADLLKAMIEAEVKRIENQSRSGLAEMVTILKLHKAYRDALLQLEEKSDVRVKLFLRYESQCAGVLEYAETELKLKIATALSVDELRAEHLAAKIDLLQAQQTAKDKP